MQDCAFQLRASHRFPAVYPVVFAGAPFVGEGTLADLSLTGCSITCSRTALKGSYVKLTVLLPNQPASLFVELGRIRWVRGRSFGVEFIRLPMMARQPIGRSSWERLAEQLKQQNTRR
jgi:hypothetical protein